MRTRATRVLLAVLVLAGCTPQPAPAKPEKIVLTRELIHAFRDAVYAHYDLRLLADPGHAFKEKPETELAAAQKNEQSARERLVAALAAAGSREARSGDKLSDLIPILRDALVRTGKYTFIIEPDSESVSFALVRLVQPPQERSIAIFGESFAYTRYLHDETLIEDYATYRQERVAKTPALIRPALTLGRAIYLDLAAARMIGRDKFFPRIDAYRELARAASAGDEPFLAQATDLPRLLAVAKDVLRWRSLEVFWATVQAQPADDQAQEFAQTYVDREEVRAACEAFELEKARAAGYERPAGEKLIALEKRTYLAAVVHGEPLSQVATIVGLASDLAASKGAALDPGVEARLKAAASVTVALVRQLGGAAKARPDTPAEDAKDLARLARASADDLKKAAQTVDAQLSH